MVDDNALLVLRKRYLIKDNKGNPVEIPDEMFHGVAGFIARAEYSYKWQEGNLANLLPALFSPSKTPSTIFSVM
jgi:ribonucleotide reductase alpha subunit